MICPSLDIYIELYHLVSCSHLVIPRWAVLELETLAVGGGQAGVTIVRRESLGLTDSDEPFE